ncbi:hypothetical protein DFH06DRAFT_1233495 [Mycena polygramma]|nr:hypothetical protein DFH06DRAFT_1233495 [Mycena polygramma]
MDVALHSVFFFLSRLLDSALTRINPQVPKLKRVVKAQRWLPFQGGGHAAIRTDNAAVLASHPQRSKVMIHTVCIASL